MRRARRASKKAAAGQTAQFLGARHAWATGPVYQKVLLKETWVWPGSIKHGHKHHDVTCWFVKSSFEIFRLASGVWARHRPDCETDFVKSWVKNRPRLKLWMTKIYKVNFMIYSVWSEINNRAHKLIREVFTEAPATDVYGEGSVSATTGGTSAVQTQQLHPSFYFYRFWIWWRNWGLLVTK